MSRRAAEVLAAPAVAVALLLCACGAPRTALIPAPPSEVRRDAGAAAAPAAAPALPARPISPAAGSAPAQPVVTVPDRLGEYAAACDVTAAAIARGGAREAAPLWRALEDSKWGTDAVFNQGVLSQLAGDLDEAAAQYARAAERSPAFEPPLANLLGIALLRGDRGRMESLLARAAPAGVPPSPTILPELAVNAAAALLATGRRDDAAAFLRAQRSRGNTAPELAWNLAVLSFRTGDLAAARELARTVAPNVANLYPVIASRFAWAGDGEKVPVLGPAPPGMAGMAALSVNLEAYAAYRGGNAEAAEKALAPAAVGAGAPAEILTNIGMLQAEQGRWAEARASLERAVAQDPALPAAWLNLGIFREVYEGDAARARECYANYVKLQGSRKEDVRTWLDRLGQSVSPPQ